MVMAVVTAHILSPSSELEKLLPVKIHVLSLSLLLLIEDILLPIMVKMFVKNH